MDVKSHAKDFSSFLNSDTVINTAIGVSIGTAFGVLITSFIKDLLAPLASAATGKTGYRPYAILRKGSNYPYKTSDDAEKDDAVVLKYGNFLQSMLYFFICGISAYGFIKVLQRLPKK